ncbi:hypothetical protein [Psychromonas aquatilis]|uniref:50S ribosomal protein L28 n=1 Tax=Psychromonas aquatilis TaxID=2005072 RepID=A0ABU9GSL7_9GAMM
MTVKVKSITAIGTRGSVKGKLFVAKTDSQGRYVLNKKASSPVKGNKTNRAINKVYVSSLCEAADLLATENYLINLISPEGSRALREFKKVKIERV